jgi:hypothetical protein
MNIGPALAALLPSVGVGLIFWLVIRSLMNADRTERAALARMDAAEAAESEHANGTENAS